MATESNNIQTNSFGRGMNSDTSFDMVPEGQYIFGQNIRITTNALLGQIVDSNSTEGIITPIENGQVVTTDAMYRGTRGQYRILATASIDNIGAVIITDNEKWYVYRVDFGDVIKYSLQFESEKDAYIKDIKKFSVVINREMEDVVKLYIADGVHQLMQINIKDKDDYNSKISGNTDNITSNHIYPSLPIRIDSQISGSLKTSQVQYTYRLYKRFGISSRLAPLTNKIQIIDSNRNKEEGNAQNTTTSMGLQISIPITELNINKDIFDHVQVYRLSYKNPQQDAEVDLIYDSFIKDSNLTIRDDGNTSLKTLSIDELSAINSMILIPQNIEQNQNYMFISNIKDNTVLRIDKNTNIDSRAYQRRIYQDGNGVVLRNNNDPLRPKNLQYYNEVSDIQDSQFATNPFSVMNPAYGDDIYAGWQACKYKREGANYYWGGEGKNVNWKFVTTDIVVHDNFNQYSPNPPYSTGNQSHKALYYLDNNSNKIPSGLTTFNYLQQHGINAMKSLEYDDVIGSSMFRSLRRDEVYRYGIIYYDKYGKRSDVQWIGDLRTPTAEECPNTTCQFGSQTGVSQNITGNIGTGVNFNYYENYNMHLHNRDHYLFTPVTGLHQYIQGNKTLQLQVTGTSVGTGSIEAFNSAVGQTFKVDVKLNVNGQWYEEGQVVPISGGANVFVLFNLVKSTIPCHHIDPDDRYTYDGVETVKWYYDDGFPGGSFFSKLKIYSDEHGGSFDSGAWDDIWIGFNVNCNIKVYDGEIESVVRLDSNPLGIQFDVSVPKNTGITSYQIVRCSKQSEYSKTIMQCALSRPVWQYYGGSDTSASLKSPYYPTPFLSSQFLTTFTYFTGQATQQSYNLFQIHSSEISTFPQDALSQIQKNDSTLKPVTFAYQDKLYTLTYALNGYAYQSGNIFPPQRGFIYFQRNETRGVEGQVAIDFKSGSTCNFYMYNKTFNTKNVDGYTLNKDAAIIEEVSKVQTPTWDKGFTNIAFNGSSIVGGVKAYKSYVSTVKTDQYVNWVCNGMYNLRISSNESQIGLGQDDDSRATKVFTYLNAEDSITESRGNRARGWIGPGPQCILVRLSNPSYIYNNCITNEQLGWECTLGTLICNVQHTAQQFAGFTDQEKQFDIYYGFGNYGNLTDDGNGNMKGSLIVFDGDVYNLPCELVSMYKTYNFNSIKDTIPSAQIVNYVPLETKINTFFDYGMNYRNTQSPNLQIEPGEITGVCSQDRPQHQYNPIYSDNNVSNDVYNAQSEEWHDQNFPQRIFYSLLKTNGEAVDSWSDFRALDYIDADTRYGDITHMLTDKDVLYFWQQKAFGKLSVNERSLVTDNNNNTVQLGQGGVLQRTDYISTIYGLRKDDRSAISTQDGVFWIDIVNKAILLHRNGQVVNYGEQLNVQNIINSNIDDDVPDIEYDYQNQELLCKCLNQNKQLVFNTKLGCATSIYTRGYEDIIKYNNILYGLTYDYKTVRYNYLEGDVTKMPYQLEFVVNQIPSVTKVFDNQQINTLKRNYDKEYAENFMMQKQFIFTTNLNESRYDKEWNVITDREGNICYTIPRIGNGLYGNRLRGRWMKVKMIDDQPDNDYSMSHVLTKFRQSFN